jgi:hypothetical protein
MPLAILNSFDQDITVFIHNGHTTESHSRQIFVLHAILNMLQIIIIIVVVAISKPLELFAFILETAYYLSIDYEGHNTPRFAPSPCF